jgi:hypothetical protein
VVPRSRRFGAGCWARRFAILGDDMDAFEEQMRKKAPSWSAFDIRMMFEGYLERGFVERRNHCAYLRDRGNWIHRFDTGVGVD